MTTPTASPSMKGQIILKALQDAVTKNLEKKRRLGHYIVIWQDGRPVLVGEDAPKPES